VVGEYGSSSSARGVHTSRELVFRDSVFARLRVSLAVGERMKAYWAKRRTRSGTKKATKGKKKAKAAAPVQGE
jgi:hypothetical protein